MTSAVCSARPRRQAQRRKSRRLHQRHRLRRRDFSGDRHVKDLDFELRLERTVLSLRRALDPLLDRPAPRQTSVLIFRYSGRRLGMRGFCISQQPRWRNDSTRLRRSLRLEHTSRSASAVPRKTEMPSSNSSSASALYIFLPHGTPAYDFVGLAASTRRFDGVDVFDGVPTRYKAYDACGSSIEVSGAVRLLRIGWRLIQRRRPDRFAGTASSGCRITTSLTTMINWRNWGSARRRMTLGELAGH